jgi:hypothetical protein
MLAVTRYYGSALMRPARSRRPAAAASRIAARVSGSYHAKAGTYLAGALAGTYFENE